MDPGRWRQIEQIYHLASGKAGEERAAFLAGACAGDEALRREVESLLEVSDDADGYLNAAVRGSGGEGSEAGTGARMDAAPAVRKLGRYDILEQVGKGGMGVVYRAADPAIGRTVAIKTISFDDAGEEQRSELRARLMRESQAGGQLTHPNIVAVYDVSEEGAVAYIVMEYVAGWTLDRAMAGEGPVRPAGEALRIVEECARALDYAHSHGVVHRDIKPANIMLQADGAVKIADFGIAKASRLTPLTQSGIIVGSPHYMAPEQWKGEAVTGRTDQWALAAVAYTLLTGRRPFASETVASVAARTLYEEPPAATSVNPGLPAAVDGVFRKALSKTGEGRYETCGAFAGALRLACETMPARAAVHPPAPVRKRFSAAAIILVPAFLAAAGGAWLYERNSATQVEMAYWASIKDSKSGAPFDAYLKRYPEGQFAELARAQSAVWKEQRPVAQNPPDPTAEKGADAPKRPARAPEQASHEPARVPLPKEAKRDAPSADEWYTKGDSSLKRADYAEAVSYFSRAIQAMPEYRSYFGRAGAYQRLERMEPAIADYSDAIRINPGSAMAYHERAVCLARLNQDDRALADYNRAIELAPGYPLSWNGRGAIYLHRKLYREAVADFTEAIRLKPALDQAFKNRAAARKALGDTAGAAADLDHARALKQ